MTIRGILLDFYGTVVEEDDAVIARITGRIAEGLPGVAAPEVGSRWGRAFFGAVAGASGATFRTQRELGIRSLETVLGELGSPLDAESLCAPQFEYWRRPALRPGSAEFLAACPVPLCVVSNIDRADLDDAIAHAGLEGTHLVSSEDVRSYKPRPELFRAGLDLLGLGPGEVLHVGDSLAADVAGATALGIAVAWVNRRGVARPDGFGVVAEVTDLREVLPLIRASSTAI